jgi:hypothetical protein
MLWRPAVLGSAFRLMAVGVTGFAIAMLLQPAPMERRADTGSEAVVAAPDNQMPPAPNSNSWSLRSGGWFIRVDGVAADLPATSRPAPRARGRSATLSISAFDDVIAEHARAEGFDWRLVAALIFEESGFNPASRSEKGAVGLMQVRPIAAETVGAQRFTAPDDNVKAGVRYLRHLDELFRAAQGRDRLSLVLAAYNMGPGHVRDAQGLARRLGFDPHRWQGTMESILPLLEEPAIWQALPNGFAKGSDTVAYVRRILDRYRRYQLETAGAMAAPSSG